MDKRAAFPEAHTLLQSQETCSEGPGATRAGCGFGTHFSLSKQYKKTG